MGIHAFLEFIVHGNSPAPGEWTIIHQFLYRNTDRADYRECLLKAFYI